MHFSKLLALACVSLAGTVTADVHHLFTGTFGSAYVYSIEFDDQALTLTLANTIASHASHSWIAFDVRFLTTKSTKSSLLTTSLVPEEEPLWCCWNRMVQLQRCQ
jgi:hypothetical protein